MSNNFVRYFNKLDSIKITNDKLKRIEEALWNWNTTKKILPIILEFEGKKPSKHIANKIEKLTGLKAQFEYKYGMYHIEIEKPIKMNENKYSLLIGYDTKPVIEEKERLEYYAQSYLLEKERAEKIKAGLNKIGELTKRFNKALEELQAVNQEAEQYEMKDTFDLCNEDITK